jgi:O-antigen ligase
MVSAFSFGADENVPMNDCSNQRFSLPRYEYLLFLFAALATSLLTVQLESLLLLSLLVAGVLLAGYTLSAASVRSWHYLFIASVLVVPALYPSQLGGEIPVYGANLIFGAGCFLVLNRQAEFQTGWDSIGKAAAGFLLAVALSIPFGFWLSGTSEGAGSCLRFFLLLHPFLIYYWLRGYRPAHTEESLILAGKFLLGVGVAAALYGIIDFYFPIPIAHPFADQYIYLAGRRIRRAQGLFYEASSFGNLAAFLLSLTLAILLSWWKQLPAAYKLALYLMAGVFTTALFLSYSRGSWANVLVTMTVFLALQRKPRLQLAAASILAVGGFVFLVYQFSPLLVHDFFSWRMGTLLEFWSDPNLATSGRWDAWWRLTSFFADHPWYLIFGIGYKTLPHTHLLGRPVIADNGFLSLTFETGLIGLAAFVWLNQAVFSSTHRARRQQSSVRAVCATLMFAFWCGEMVQMVTGDLFTYWRNMVVFFAAMALVQEVPERSVNTN